MPPSWNRDDSRPQSDDQTDATDQRRLALFRKRLEAGNYDAILGLGLRRTLRGAAADSGLEAETGALRLALVRLLTDESDPSRLAAGVARLTTVSVQVARLRNAPDADLDAIRAHLIRELDAIELEQAEERARQHR